MPIEEQDSILIEKYLLGQLTTEELRIFEKRSEDVDFSKELELQKDLQVAFKAEGRIDLKNQLKNFEAKISVSEAPKQSKARRFALKPILAFAASFLLLIIAAYWLLNRSSDGEQYFAQYFEPYPNVVIPVNKGNNTTDLKSQAFRAYESKNYETALGLFSQLPSTNDTLQFYRGICALSMGNLPQAGQYFASVEQSASSFYAPANWYRALALIKAEKPQEAIYLLDIVIANAQTAKLREMASDLKKQLE